jgi:hypothetical protein
MKKTYVFASLLMLALIVPACHAQQSVKNTVWGLNGTTPVQEAAGINLLGHIVFGDVTADFYQTWYVDSNSALGQATLVNNNAQHGVPKNISTGTFTQNGETIRITFVAGGIFSGTIRANVMTITNQGGTTLIFTKVKSLNGLEPVQ